MKDILVKYIAIFLWLVYLVMQLLCTYPDDNRRQIVFILWFAFTYMVYTPIVKRSLLLSINILLYSFLLFIGVSMLYKHTVLYSISAALSFCSLFSPLLMFRVLRTETKIIRRFVFIAITILLVSNFIVCSTYMGDSFTGRGLRNAEMMTNLKNTFFTTYAFAIIVPFVVYFISHKNKNNTRHRWLISTLLGYAVCIALAFFVIKAQFMTAMVLMIMGSVIAIAYNHKGAKIVVPIVTGISLLLFLTYSDSLIRLAEENDATATVQRIEELQNILENKSSEAKDYSLRQDLSQSSLQTFLENPLFGVFYKYESIMEAKNYGIGNHAEWLDTLAKYGLFGLLLLIYTFKVTLRQKKVVGTSIHYILFVLLGFLNPVLSFYLTCTVFLYLPLMGIVLFNDSTQSLYGKI